MAVIVNLKGVKTHLELLPDSGDDGVPATLNAFQFGLSKKNQPKVDLTFVFDASAGEPYVGRKAFIQWSLQPQSVWRMKRDLISMGVDPDALEDEAFDVQAMLQDLQGTDGIMIKVGHEFYNNKPQQRWSIVDQTGSEFSTPDYEEADAVGAR